jgi:GNAT superfamily N-acetyltransferase
MTPARERRHAPLTAPGRHFRDRRAIPRSTVSSFVRLAFVQPQELTIRRYLPSDRTAVWDLHVTALEAVGARALDPEARGVDADFADMDGVYLRNSGEFLVGLLGDRIVAIGALKRLSSTVAEIARMRVHPQFWRCGYGETILRHLELAAASRGYTELWLDTLPIQTAAQHLYMKNGFREYCRVQVRGYQACEAILFRKAR